MMKPVVLCLDDDPAILGSFRRLLRNEPYDLVTTANPGEALTCLQNSNVDVVISDERMPWMSGTAFLKIVERHSPGTARLIVSGHPQVADMVKRQGNLVHHFIAKPWDDADLCTLLRGLVKRSPEAPKAKADFMVERPVLVECTGRAGKEVSPKLQALLRRARLEGRDVVAVFEGLDRMEEDPYVLLGELVMSVDSAGVRVHVLDGSGTASEFFRSAEVFKTRLRVYSPAEPGTLRSLLLLDPVAPRRTFLKLLYSALGHSCRAVATPDEARSALDGEPADMMLMELSEAGDPEIAFVRDLARTSRAMDVVPLLAKERVWSPTLARKWRLIRPLVRPYRFLDLHDAPR
jgi:DNA-binding NtrC family response regulator